MRNPYYNSNSLYSYHSPYNSTPAFSYAHSYNHSYHQNRADLVEAGASLGFVGSGAALMTGKVSASLVGAKLAAAGLAIGSGGMIPLIGAIATLGMGILAGAMGLKAAKTLGKEGIRGLEYLGERAAVNMPVQGLAADIMKLAMIEVDNYLQREFEKNSVKIILQIHDEIILEAPKNVAEKVSKNVKQIMEKVCKLKVPLVVDVAMGSHWGEL